MAQHLRNEGFDTRDPQKYINALYTAKHNRSARFLVKNVVILSIEAGSINIGIDTLNSGMPVVVFERSYQFSNNLERCTYTLYIPTYDFCGIDGIILQKFKGNVSLYPIKVTIGKSHLDLEVRFFSWWKFASELDKNTIKKIEFLWIVATEARPPAIVRQNTLKQPQSKGMPEGKEGGDDNDRCTTLVHPEYTRRHILLEDIDKSLWKALQWQNRKHNEDS